MMMAGATAVEIGSDFLANPYHLKQIIDDLPKVMEKYNITSLKELKGE